MKREIKATLISLQTRSLLLPVVKGYITISQDTIRIIALVIQINLMAEQRF